MNLKNSNYKTKSRWADCVLLNHISYKTTETKGKESEMREGTNRSEGERKGKINSFSAERKPGH